MNKLDNSTSSIGSSVKRVAFQTYGCRSNYADSVDLQTALSERGHVPCEIDSDADVYVINTCTVTDNADREALRLIRKIKRERPDARVVVTGCMAEVETATLESMPEIDAVVGPGRKAQTLEAILAGYPVESTDDLNVNHQLVSDPELVQLTYSSGRRTKKSLPERRSISLNQKISPLTPAPGEALGELKARARYHLRVQEGCENSCTFCIIPLSRGRLSSRPISEVLADINFLSNSGYGEIILTGTHLGGYGEDISSSLFELLSRVVELESPSRIRISSIDPNDLDKKIIDLIAKSSSFCHYLHICVQAFSDPTLKRMNRKYRMGHVEEILNYVIQQMPTCAIGSDVIAGFPGESRQEVDQAMETFLRLPFSYLHVFPYSERKGTAATRLTGVVDLRERKRRAARWRALGEVKREQYLKSLIGTPVEIVVEHQGEDSLSGTSREFVQAEIICGRRDVALYPIGSRVVGKASRFDSIERKLICEL